MGKERCRRGSRKPCSPGGLDGLDTWPRVCAIIYDKRVTSHLALEAAVAAAGEQLFFRGCAERGCCVV